MKRAYQSLICAGLFLLLTAIKMMSPASASDIRETLLPVIDRDDNYRQIIHRIGNSISQKPKHIGTLTLPESPLDQIRSVLDAPGEYPLADLPKVSYPPEPSPEETPLDAALEYGYQARETFLQLQAEVTDQEPPDNVSYEVLTLPFSETSPVAGDSSSGFGYRIHPIQGTLRFHYGTDFAADEGDDVLAFADGIVSAAGEDEGYGNYVKVDHGDGFVTLYGHCSRLLVSEGETVTMGQCIALVGSTGEATGPHLHFELIHDGVYLNPEFYLYA